MWGVVHCVCDGVWTVRGVSRTCGMVTYTHPFRQTVHTSISGLTVGTSLNLLRASYHSLSALLVEVLAHARLHGICMGMGPSLCRARISFMGHLFGRAAPPFPSVQCVALRASAWGTYLSSVHLFLLRTLMCRGSMIGW